MRNEGFTLLEVLVAISIFVLIGLGSNRVLSTIINTRDITESRTEQFIKLQRAFVVIERDLAQFTNRTIRDELGDPLAALLIGTNLYNLEFTRLGWRNPTAAPRSNLQRVAYQLLDGELLRHYWLVLDRAEDSEPVTQKILTDVEDFRVTAFSAEGEATYLWPPDDDNPGLEIPTALELIISIERIGEIRKVVSLISLPKRSSGAQGQAGGDGQQGSRDDNSKEDTDSSWYRQGNSRNKKDEDDDDW